MNLLSPLGLKDFRYLWIANAFSHLGDWAARLALASLVFEATGSAALTGLVTVVAVSPWVVGPVLAGAFSRFPNRNVMMAADLIRLLAFLLLGTDLALPLMFFVLALAAFADPPFDASQAAVTREAVVDDELYFQARSLSQVSSQITQLLGLFFGGVLLVAVGAEGALLVNAATFAISLIFVLKLSVGRQSNVHHGNALATAKLGFQVIHRDPFLWRVALAAILGTIGGSTAEALIVGYAQNELRETYIAILAAVVPGATALTAIVLARKSSTNPVYLLRLGYGTMAVGSVIAAVALLVPSSGWSAIVAYAAAGVTFGAMPPMMAITGMRIPDDVRAPAFSVLQSSLRLGEMLVVGAMTAVATFVGVRYSIAIAMGLAAVIMVLFSVTTPKPKSHSVA